MAGLRNTLQLKTTQSLSLSMTPQLQQAIKLLQLTTLEVRQEIAQMLEQNPLLEEADDRVNSNVQSLDAMIDAARAAESVYDPFDNDHSASPADISLSNEVYSSEDGSQAHDALSSINQSGELNAQSTAAEQRFDDFNAAQVSRKGAVVDNDRLYEGETHLSLQDHLTWQLDCSPLTGMDKAIAEAIIDGISDSGYLTESLEDIFNSLKPDWPELTMEEICTVLKLVQHYDPLGVGSRDVGEYLLIQLGEMPDDTPNIDTARKLLRNYLEELVNRDYRALCSHLSIKEDTLKEVLELITSLNQRPGQGIAREKADFIIPDVLVVKGDNGGFKVITNPNNTLPKLRINKQYAAMAKSVKNDRDRSYLLNSRQEANYFIKTLENRTSTVLTVAQCIMDKQRDFLEKGESAIVPLILSDIASEVGLHESTVSRATSGKFIQTPRGTYELKYFFSSHVDTDDGGAASATAIRAIIKDLISKENPRRPLSDAALAEKLQDQGIKVARRTIAKYREALGLPSSAQRKRLI